jgi:hypothetical protein
MGEATDEKQVFFLIDLWCGIMQNKLLFEG